MIETLVNRIGSPFVHLWLKWSPQSWRSLPRPPGQRTVHAVGPNPDSLALVGAGVAVGYGVRSTGLALSGQLARQVAELTHRGVTVETVADLQMRMATFTKAITQLDLRRFDALVITLGTNEALILVPATQFRRELERLLGWLDRTRRLR